MYDWLKGTPLGGRYEVRDLLGSGGMGAVYDGLDHRLNRRRVAIKVIRPDLADKQGAIARFHAEAKLIASLQHRHIVYIIDFNEEIIGGCSLMYLVMHYAAGGTLANRLRSGHLSADETVRILTQICAALDFAHDNKIIHRDLKPLNILFDGPEHVLVADFGLAKLFEDQTHIDNLTKGAGTRGYMAPEQMWGGTASRATDIYALGVMLHEMLTGHVPTYADEGGGYSLVLDAKLSPRVEAVIAKATHFDRKERYQKAGELVLAFQEAISTRSHKERTNSQATKTDTAPTTLGNNLEDAVRRAQPGAMLSLAAGVYHLDRPLQIDKALTLRGAGMEQTRVTCSGEGYVVRFSGNGLLAAHDLTFAHEGQQWVQVVDVVSGEVNMQGCRFTGGVRTPVKNRAGNGLWLHGNARGTVVGCDFTGNAGNGIAVTGQAQPTLEANTCRTNEGSGIRYGGNANGIARENICAGNLFHGIEVYEQARPTLEANTCQQNDRNGLDYWGMASGTAHENICIENLYSGIEVYEQARPTLEANTCCKNKWHGIRYSGNATGDASQNTCSDNQANGVEVTDQAQPALEANSCRDNGWSGIYYWGSASGSAYQNNCASNQANGIAVTDQARPTLEGNTCETNQGNGIYYEDIAGGTVHDNACINNRRAGIYIMSTAQPIITDNTCRNNAGGAIEYQERSNHSDRHQLAVGQMTLFTSGTMEEEVEAERDTPSVGRPAQIYVAAPHASVSLHPRVLPSPHIALDQAIPDYLTYLTALGRSQHTIKSFEIDLRLLYGQVGNRAVGAIDTGQLRQFIAWVRETRANSPNSVRRKVATLKNFFSYLRDEGYLPASPADAVPYPEAYVALPEFLGEDEALQLIEATEDNPFWRALIILLLDTGLKRDEALALRVTDVHLADGAANSMGSYLIVRATDAAKRLRTRKLPVSERLRDSLRAYYKATRHTQADESRIFDMSVRGISSIVEECGTRAGIETGKPRLTPQVLRETFAVAQMRARMQEERRCQMRGWSDEQMRLLSARHNAEVMGLLGLREDADTVRKYRLLAEA